MRVLMMIALLIGLAGCRGRAAPPQYSGNAEEVMVLKTPDNPYRIIYNPPVDLAKKPGS